MLDYYYFGSMILTTDTLETTFLYFMWKVERLTEYRSKEGIRVEFPNTVNNFLQNWIHNYLSQSETKAMIYVLRDTFNIAPNLLL